MPLTELNHYFVRTNDLEQSKRFYCEVLGFEEMPRPNFPFPGYWLGVNGRIQVHMGPHGIPNSELYYLGTTPQSATDNTGIVDHIAFLATEPENFAKRFAALDSQRASATCRVPSLPDVREGSGRITIELNFNGIDAEPDWGADGGTTRRCRASPKARGSWSPRTIRRTDVSTETLNAQSPAHQSR
jgi:catechol 2,3-dioxygenase-like lactoylglutathione lyase family enzyme